MNNHSEAPLDVRALEQFGNTCEGLGALSNSGKMSCNKRKRFTNDVKYEVLKMYEKGETKAELISKYGMSSSALNLWIRNKSQLYDDVEVNSRYNVKSRHRSPVWRVEQPLVQFFEHNDKRKGSDRIPLTGPTISEIAIRICNELLQKHEQQPFLGDTELEELKKFSASESWARKFARTHGWKSFGNKDRQKVRGTSTNERLNGFRATSAQTEEANKIQISPVCSSIHTESIFPSEKPRLIYSGQSCHIDICRVLLHAGSIEFDESQEAVSCYAFQDEAPFGELPLLIHGNVKLAQAGAINRYCARLGGLYPENPMEASRVDMIHDRCLDILSKLFLTKNAFDGERQNAVWTFLRDSFLPSEFGYLEKILAESDDNYFGGDELNAADVVFYAVYRVYEQTGIGASEILDNFARLKVSIDGTRNLGKVKDFVWGESHFPYKPCVAALDESKIKRSLFSGYSL
mmetsp:Transcript_15363/g.20363  ORF Transcript_15363/g.20363 Transcript_15363/m.20363 type:complete len:461 (+) Transcript_15363:89-1471(+)